jgi:hypothetical protein
MFITLLKTAVWPGSAGDKIPSMFSIRWRIKIWHWHSRLIVQQGNYPESLTVMFNLTSERKMDTDFKINHTKYFELKTWDHKFIARQNYARKERKSRRSCTDSSRNCREGCWKVWAYQLYETYIATVKKMGGGGGAEKEIRKRKTQRCKRTRKYFEKRQN